MWKQKKNIAYKRKWGKTEDKLPKQMKALLFNTSRILRHEKSKH